MTGEVIPFDPQQQRKDRPPPLSDAELLALRQMLADFATTCQVCPIARQQAHGR